jgi:hypothetical protein
VYRHINKALDALILTRMPKRQALSFFTEKRDMKNPRLSKLKMPAESGPDLGLEMEDELDFEESEEEGLEDDIPEESGSLDDVSDEELLAEMEKRGLMKDLEDESFEDEEEDEEFNEEL